MLIIKTLAGINIRTLISGLIIPLMFNCIVSSCDSPVRNRGLISSGISDSAKAGTPDEYKSVGTMLVLPKNPGPGKAFRILATGGENIRKAQIIVSGPSGSIKSVKNKIGKELPYWRIDDFAGSPPVNIKSL